MSFVVPIKEGGISRPAYVDAFEDHGQVGSVLNVDMDSFVSTVVCRDIARDVFPVHPRPTLCGDSPNADSRGDRGNHDGTRNDQVGPGIVEKLLQDSPRPRESLPVAPLGIVPRGRWDLQGEIRAALWRAVEEVES